MKSNRLTAESAASTEPARSAFSLVSLVAPFAIGGRVVQVPAANSALNGNPVGKEGVAAEAAIIPLRATGA